VKKPPSKNTKWLVLATVCFALFMINLDGNVVNLAMPTIIRQFGATLSQMEWISNAYMLTFAVFLITLGRLGDAVGRRLLFLAGLAGFTVGSALCGFAANVGQLIAFRVLQGIGGSAMMPATLSLITANFRKEEQGRAMGFWGAVAGLSFIMGPIIGGWLTQVGLGPALNRLLGVSDTWRYVFFVNLPFGAIAFPLTLAVVPESKDEESKHRLDVVGVVLSSLAVLLLTWGFVEGPRYGWWKATHDLSIGGAALRPFGLSVVPFLLAAAAILVVVFVLYERSRRTDPLVDLSLFRIRNYSVGMVTGIILNFALMGAMFLMPLYCQFVLGIDPVRTGTLMLPFALSLLVTSPLAGILSDRIGGKTLLVAGLAILAASDFLVARFRMDTPTSQLALPFVVMGIGMGFSMTPLTNLTLQGVPPQKTGGASGLISTTRQIGAVMGVAVFSVILQTSMGSAIAVRAAEVVGLPPAAQAALVGAVRNGGLSGMLGAGPGVPGPGAASMPPAVADGILRAVKESFTDGVTATFRVAALVGIAAVLVSLFMTGRRKPALSLATNIGESSRKPNLEDERMAAGE